MHDISPVIDKNKFLILGKSTKGIMSLERPLCPAALTDKLRQAGLAISAKGAVHAHGMGKLWGCCGPPTMGVIQTLIHENSDFQ
jgi:hypothetical protein